MLQFTVYCSEAFKIQETPFSLFQSQLKNGNHKHPKKKYPTFHPSYCWVTHCIVHAST